MKNVRLIAALLAATVVTSSVLAAEAPQEAPKGRLKTVRKQFNESLDRFKRCMQGKCTRWEALKVARDLTITAVAVVGVMYGVGAGLKKGAIMEEKYTGRAHAYPLYKFGEALQAPVTAAAWAVPWAVQRAQLVLQFPIGSKLFWDGKTFFVKGYKLERKFPMVLMESAAGEKRWVKAADIDFVPSAMKVEQFYE